jgi:hypothetical protein
MGYEAEAMAIQDLDLDGDQNSAIATSSTDGGRCRADQPVSEDHRRDPAVEAHDPTTFSISGHLGHMNSLVDLPRK